MNKTQIHSSYNIFSLSYYSNFFAFVTENENELAHNNGNSNPISEIKETDHFEDETGKG